MIYYSFYENVASRWKRLKKNSLRERTSRGKFSNRTKNQLKLLWDFEMFSKSLSKDLSRNKFSVFINCRFVIGNNPEGFYAILQRHRFIRKIWFSTSSLRFVFFSFISTRSTSLRSALNLQKWLVKHIFFQNRFHLYIPTHRNSCSCDTALNEFLFYLLLPHQVCIPSFVNSHDEKILSFQYLTNMLATIPSVSFVCFQEINLFQIVKYTCAF